jgi:hypothetical protein
MAFVRKVGGAYWWPGVIRTPNESVEGELDEAPIKLKFKRVGQKESAAYAGDKELLKGIIVGWDLVEDDKGNPVPFSVDTLTEYLDDQFFSVCVSSIYFDALQKARTGN